MPKEISQPEFVSTRRTAVMFLALLASGSAIAQTAPEGPSFDCNKARGRVDLLICADAELATLDRGLAELFAGAQAQTLDPGELKKTQRKWLRQRDDCESAECVTQQYRQRIETLATLTGRFATTFSARLCGLFEQSQTRTPTLEATAGANDINNDGTTDIATDCTSGTANIPCTTYVDEKQRPLDIQAQGFDWNTYSALGRAPFRYEGRTFIYHSRDVGLSEPAYISFVTPQNREIRVCDFETENKSATVEGGDDVCAAVAANDQIEPIELTRSSGEGVAFARADTYMRATGAVDIDNDGLDEKVVELSYESGAGQGCTFNYYELLDDDERALLDNANSKPVRELQGIANDGYRERNCGSIVNRLLKFDDKVYYETNTTNNRLVPHEVRKLDGTAVDTLCTFEREVTTKIKTLF